MEAPLIHVITYKSFTLSL